MSRTLRLASPAFWGVGGRANQL